MRRWRWQRLLISIAIVLIVLGLAPLGYLYWFGAAHTLEPLSFALPLERGEYTSPSFKTDLDEAYQIDIYFIPYHRTPLNLDWKIVDESGALLKNGSYREGNQLRYGNDIILDRQYRTKRGLRQKIIVTIPKDVTAASSEPRLHIGLPEESLGMAYGFGAALVWAAVVESTGVILLVLWMILRRRQRAQA